MIKPDPLQHSSHLLLQAQLAGMAKQADRRGKLSTHDVVDFGEDALESELDVGRLQGGGLDEGEALLLAELLRVVRLHAPQVPARADTHARSSPKQTAKQTLPRPLTSLSPKARSCCCHCLQHAGVAVHNKRLANMCSQTTDVACRNDASDHQQYGGSE